MLLEILRSALWDTPLDIAERPDWDSVINLLEKHSVTGLAASAVMKLPADLQPSYEQQNRLLSSVARTISKRSEQDILTASIFSRLRKAGCSPVLLKGRSIDMYFPEGTIRTCGDIDIYVGKKNFDTARRAVWDMVEETTPPELFESIRISTVMSEDCEWNTILEGEDIEIHRYPGWPGNHHRKRKYRRMGEYYLAPDKCSSIVLEGTEIPVARLHYMLVHCFNHICQHLANNSMGLRQFCDWALLLEAYSRSPEKDIARLKEDLKTLGILRMWKKLGGIVVIKLGLPEELFPFYDRHLARRSCGRVLKAMLQGDSAHMQREGSDRKELEYGTRRLYYSLRDIRGAFLNIAPISFSMALRTSRKALMRRIPSLFKVFSLRQK